MASDNSPSSRRQLFEEHRGPGNAPCRLSGSPWSIQRRYSRSKLGVVRVVALMGSMFVPSAALQTSSPVPTRFDVISIRPVNSVRNSSPTNIDRGHLTAQNISIRRLIQAAFNVRDYQILNAPGWIDGARYDVLAKSDSATDLTDKQMAPMIQDLLKDRFNFRYHRETRNLSGYLLIAAKGGPRLKRSDAESGSDTNITNSIPAR